jgi:hypothetical protein
MMRFSRTKKIASTPFSDFIRNAKAGEKKRVYMKVMKEASASQRAVIERHKRSK